MSLEHRWEYNAVEDDVVLTNKVNKFCILTLPILLPIWCKFLSSRYIANWSIKPNIENFTICTLNWHRDSPIKVTAYGAWLKTTIKPTLTLTINISLPLLMTLKNPLAQHLLVVIQWQIPVGCRLLNRYRTRES